MIRLSDLKIREIGRKGQWNDNDPEITGVETNSLRVEKGYIFLARAGETKASHGLLFYNQALKRGASFVITDPEGYQFGIGKGFNPTIPCLLVEDLGHTLENICQIFYPEKPNFVMGITGTNGKTSVVNFSQQIIFPIT